MAIPFLEVVFEEQRTDLAEVRCSGVRRQVSVDHVLETLDGILASVRLSDACNEAIEPSGDGFVHVRFLDGCT